MQIILAGYAGSLCQRKQPFSVFLHQITKIKIHQVENSRTWKEKLANLQIELEISASSLGWPGASASPLSPSHGDWHPHHRWGTAPTPFPWWWLSCHFGASLWPMNSVYLPYPVVILDGRQTWVCISFFFCRILSVSILGILSWNFKMVFIHSFIKYLLSDCVGKGCMNVCKHSLRGYFLFVLVCFVAFGPPSPIFS